MKLLTVLALLVTANSFGQNLQSALPLVVFSAGAGYAPSSRAIGGWASFSVETAPLSRVYSITTMDISPTISSLRTGVAYLAWRSSSGNWNVLTHIDGGMTSLSATATASLATGAIVMYDFGGIIPALKGNILTGVVRLVAAGTKAGPVYELGLSRSF